MTGEKRGCMHGLVMEYCRECRSERMKKAAIAGAAALAYEDSAAADKRKCAHGWPEKLHPRPACTMDKSLLDAMDASKPEQRRVTGFDAAGGPDRTVEMDYQLKEEGVEVVSITDKSDPKNTQGDWFNSFGGDENNNRLRNFQASLDARSRQALDLASEVNKLRDTVRDRDTEIRVLRQACKAAGDEIRGLHAQRKPVRHGAYLLTFPECGPSAGMYWAGGLALLFLGACFAWAVK